MTGHGEATDRDNLHTVSVEIRTVNNRYLKTSIRLSDGFSSLEPRIEELIKSRVRRGSVYLTIRVDRQASADDFRLNGIVLGSYRAQLLQVFPELSVEHLRPELLLNLPGVIESGRQKESEVDETWPVLESALRQALERMDQMRRNEGEAMAIDLRRNCEVIANELDEVEKRAPEVMAIYQERLTERLNSLLAPHEISIEPKDIAREVGVYADRCDISEEVVRLRSHLRQFTEILANEPAAGKKLDFLTQEMFREVNTIGSKANNADIARHVIEMKAAVERIREMTQNLE